MYASVWTRKVDGVAKDIIIRTRVGNNNISPPIREI